MSGSTTALRIAALVKQVPRFEEMKLGTDRRLVRGGLELEMNPYCRRAVSMGVTLAKATGGHCTVFTLGPPSAEDVLREAIAWGAHDGVLLTDPTFAGSDTLATARALAAALRREGPFDVVLTGRNSVDADTGQVGPQIAEFLDIAFIGGARVMEIADDVISARLEHDDGWVNVSVPLPAVVSCAERLCEPCKVDPPGRAAVPADRIRRVSATDLGVGPWGHAGSPTRVGEIRVHEHKRQGRVLAGSLAEQASQTAELLCALGALRGQRQATAPSPIVVSSANEPARPGIAVVFERGRERVGRELLGAAAALASSGSRCVTAIVPTIAADLAILAGWGADHVVLIDPSVGAQDVATSVSTWCLSNQPWAVLLPSTMWGREVAGRLAARLGAGLTGDAIGLDEADDRLIGWKPAFGGQLVAAITATSSIQLATVRPGVLALLEPRVAKTLPGIETLATNSRQLVQELNSGRDDDVEILATARVVVGVGAGVDHRRYDELADFVAAIGGTLAATRKVTDSDWMPRARQVGITGRSIAPSLYVAIGVSGKFNHMVGARAAETVLAINSDEKAPVFNASDIGIVGDWTAVIPLLTAAIKGRYCA